MAGCYCVPGFLATAAMCDTTAKESHTRSEQGLHRSTLLVHTHSTHTQARTAVVEELFNQVHMCEQHASTAVPPQSQVVQCLSVTMHMYTHSHIHVTTTTTVQQDQERSSQNAHPAVFSFINNCKYVSYLFPTTCTTTTIMSVRSATTGPQHTLSVA